MFVWAGRASCVGSCRYNISIFSVFGRKGGVGNGRSWGLPVCWKRVGAGYGSEEKGISVAEEGHLKVLQLGFGSTAEDGWSKQSTVEAARKIRTAAMFAYEVSPPSWILVSNPSGPSSGALLT